MREAAPPSPPTRLARTSSLVLLQPTPLCNLDCSYCYLPSRELARVMSPDVADAVAHTVEVWSAHHPVTVLWHGGEPLATGLPRLTALLDRFPPGRGHPVRHAVQTNGTLLDDAWCRLFVERGIEVSVSIDGPGPGARADRGGHDTTGRALRGIALLREHGIPFGAVTVVSDPCPRRAVELHRWFSGLGCRTLGVNLVERKGVNVRSIADEADPAGFWAALAACGRADPRMALRDVEHALRYVRAEVAGVAQRLAGQPVDPLPMITWDGQVVPVSPDLAGFTSPRLGAFTVGDVRDVGLAGCLARAERVPWVAEALAGIDACRAGCALFAYCRGGQAANKYFETGRLDATETAFCRSSRKLLMEGLIHDAERVTLDT
ncbi:GRRM system radical SAM/SPASM domain protein [Streptomyces phaeofaciens JCM 4814]|uniref:Radical SAM protein n=1 Tax=Streptomyces phaeofaciens TaxID=68254 RepID=A0A918H2D5_9ACTN|nr:cyclophane-forming radical SAM peptide maturase AmcB [Streptomyces phaeofaciens]GGT32225.1 radical SAM protein [Streptomyces phaeofaciens]